LTEKTLIVGHRTYRYFSLDAASSLGLGAVARLPYVLKVLLENRLRDVARGRGNPADVDAFGEWLKHGPSNREIEFRPARVMMVDSSGIPLAGDLAAMRDAAQRLGGDPRRINPLVPVDFIIDHSVMVDVAGVPDAARRNVELEFARNHERYAFTKWAASAFDNLRVIPPGTGICHQINLEYLARVVWVAQGGDGDLAFPDSVLGMDSHTAMINSLGVVGWGIGGLEGGAAALNEPVALLLPEVLGCRLIGRPKPGITSTDIVLNVTRIMRTRKLVEKFVEFCGPGLDALALPDRATLSNMTPEYGATMSFFPVDAETLAYLKLTGRSNEHVARVEAYCRAQGLWRDATSPTPAYTEVIEIDLATIEPSVAGPKRPHERRALAEVPKAFASAHPKEQSASVPGTELTIRTGDVVVAAITSCTNTSNPAVMIGAGLVARNARRRGLAPKPWVKTSLSPGSRVVTGYLEASGLQADLDALGYHLAGYGCMSCMGNSGPIIPRLADVIEHDDIAVAAVLSGNRNFEGRVHPNARANFLASPPLVIAYALAGSVRIDLANEPLATDAAGQPVYLKDLWPDPAEVRAMIDQYVQPALYRERYQDVGKGTSEWQAIAARDSVTFDWDARSQYIRRPPFFDDTRREPDPVRDIVGARILGLFGDMLTTDHISPIGTIAIDSPAGHYLRDLGIEPQNFNNYASRRLNHEVMMRGTFANTRIRNELAAGTEGSATTHFPSGERVSIYDAAMRYMSEGVPLVIFAGSEYGAGSSRDWAAKGTRLLGVRAVIASSFERIHRSNLVGMGVLPLELPEGITRHTLAIRGDEVIDVHGLEQSLVPRIRLPCTITRADGRKTALSLLMRLDTRSEVEYYRAGGILHYVLRSRL
jgi:aconitate hydratase